jgi:hypothetical protein
MTCFLVILHAAVGQAAARNPSTAIEPTFASSAILSVEATDDGGEGEDDSGSDDSESDDSD